MSRVRIWPWSELAYLRRELRAAKLSSSATAKRANRLHQRILLLDRAAERQRAQKRGDQRYIDLLEECVRPVDIARIRAEMKSGGRAA